MIAFYDKNGEKFPLVGFEDYYIDHQLDGMDKMSFVLDVELKQYQQLFEECRMETEDNYWLIKKIDDDKIECELDFDFLKGTLYQNFKSETQSLQEVLEQHLPEGWTIEGANVSSIRRTISFDFCTDFDVVYACMNTYNVYFVWYIKSKRLVVYSPEKMESTGEYLTSELNLKSLSFKGETTNFATRLYAYGKDGMTIADAEVKNENGDTVKYGLPYVEDFSYADKVICAYWIDERYTVPENMYADALERVSTMSKPIRSYECDVNDLAKKSKKYSFLDFKMHKKATLIDTDRAIKVEHQIVRYKEYPHEPDRNVVTLSTVPDTIQTSISKVSSTAKEETEKVKTSFEDRLTLATAMMTSAFGSYFYKTDSELFMMDNPDVAQAQVVWRWNVNGFAKSSTGIDGPYTTALTMDDEFITNVINAIVIRGSLIEADSIEAKSIKQSYTDGVLEQSYTAAQGLVDFMAKSINEMLSNEEGSGELDVLKQNITNIQQAIDGLKLSFTTSYQGGINYIKNSSGLNGVSDDWEASGEVVALQDDDTKNRTIANSCFRLGEESQLVYLLDNIVVGKQYAISVNVKKCFDYLAYMKIIYEGEKEEIVFSVSNSFDWTQFSFVTPVIQSNNIAIEIYNRSGHLYVADIMLCEGTVAKTWTPAPNEIYTSGVKLDHRGIEVTRSDTSEKTAMTNREFAGYYEDEKVFSVNKDLTYMRRTFIDGELTVGDCKLVPYENSNDVGLIITIVD